MRKNTPRLIKNRENFHIVITRNICGKSVPEYLASLGKILPSEARRKLTEFLVSWDSRYTQKSTLFRDVIEEVRKSLENEGRPKKTLQSFDIQTRHALALWKLRPIDDILYRDIEDFKTYLKRVRKVNNSSVNIALNELRRVFKHAVRMNYIKQMPIIDKVPKPASFGIKAISPEDAQFCISHAPYEVKFYLVMMLLTGLRPKEFADAKPEDIDIQKGLMWVRNLRINKTGGENTGGRYIPLSDQAKKVLINHFKNGHEYLYPWHTFEGATSALQRLEKKTGIKLTPSMLRKSFATDAVNRGVQSERLCEIMGTSEAMLRPHYVLQNAERLRIVHENAPDWGSTPLAY